MAQRRKFEPGQAREVLNKLSRAVIEDVAVVADLARLEGDWQSYAANPKLPVLMELVGRLQAVVNRLPSDEWKKISDSLRNQRSRRMRDMVKLEISRATRDRLQHYQNLHRFESMDAALQALLPAIPDEEGG